ncbi:phage tail protein, partial [Bifidobacterium xylocopae]
DGGFGGNAMSSINAAFAAQGVTMLPNGVGVAQQALTMANTNCSNRFNDAHPSEAGNAQCRVVAVGTMTGQNKQFSGQVHHLKSDWMNGWVNTVVGHTYSNKGVGYQTNYEFQDQPGMSVDTLADQYSTDDISIVVIMLNQYEPRSETPPAPPTKDVPAGTNADSMLHDQVITTGTGLGGKRLKFTDSIDPAGQSYAVVAQSVTDTTTGADISGQFDFDAAAPGAHATWKGGD